MRRITFTCSALSAAAVLVSVLAFSAPAAAQGRDRGQGNSGGDSSGSSGGGGGHAVPRGDAGGGGGTVSGGGGGGGGGQAVSRGDGGGSTASRPTSAERGSPETRSTGADDDRSGGRPRGNRAPTGQAIRRPVSRGGSGTALLFPGGSYYGGYYPWGWGGLGFGGYGGYYGGFYDPWWYGGYGGYGGYYPTYYSSGFEGRLRLKVRPRDASVFVDGYYAGQVDEFDGIFQRLHIEPGPHRIEVRADGYEPLTFEVRILPDRTVTYEGELKRLVP